MTEKEKLEKQIIELKSSINYFANAFNEKDKEIRKLQKELEDMKNNYKCISDLYEKSLKENHDLNRKNIEMNEVNKNIRNIAIKRSQIITNIINELMKYNES